MKLTPANLLEIQAAIPQLQTRVVAITRLVRQRLYDRVRRAFLHDARRVPAGAAESRLPATAPQRDPQDAVERPRGQFPSHFPPLRPSATSSPSSCTFFFFFSSCSAREGKQFRPAGNDAGNGRILRGRFDFRRAKLARLSPHFGGREKGGNDTRRRSFFFFFSLVASFSRIFRGKRNRGPHGGTSRCRLRQVAVPKIRGAWIARACADTCFLLFCFAGGNVRM